MKIAVIQLITAIISFVGAVLSLIVLIMKMRSGTKEKDTEENGRKANVFLSFLWRHIECVLGVIAIALLAWVIPKVLYNLKTIEIPLPSNGPEKAFAEDELGQLSWRLGEYDNYFDASTINSALESLQDKGFETYEIRKIFSDEKENGTILGTLPKAGSIASPVRVEKGKELVVVVSAGKPSHYCVENVVGEKADVAREVFRNNGCKRLYTWFVCSQDSDDQTVLWQYPKSGFYEGEDEFSGCFIIGEEHDYIIVDEDGSVIVSGSYKFDSEDALLKWVQE